MEGRADRRTRCGGSRSIDWIPPRADQGPFGGVDPEVGDVRNPGKALKGNSLGGDRGDALDHHLLGAAYFNGQGVSQDYVHSYFWYSLAASRSSGAERKKYTEARDMAAEKLTPEKLVEGQRMTWEWEKSHPRK